LLTGDIALSLSDEQGAALAEILSDLVSRETLTDSEAGVVNESILALFGDDQRAKQEAVGLPVRRGGRGGGPGAGDGGGEQAEDANPFAEEGNAAALNSLLGRFGEPTAEKPASAPDSTGGESEEPATEEPDVKDAAASGVRE
jgi:hypothetical protein